MAGCRAAHDSTGSRRGQPRPRQHSAQPRAGRRKGDRDLPALDQAKVDFDYITNATKSSKPTRQVVVDANARCNQENNIAQLKQCALSAPLSDLTSNWAYMVIASLAWNLKIWSALMIKPSGTAKQKAEQATVKSKLVGMDFTTFRDRIVMVPAQIVRRSRSLIYRLLSYRPSVDLLLLIDSHIRRPLRC
jgi:hypothetical protein